MKDQGRYEKLNKAREHRDVFTEKLTVRVDYVALQKIKELSDITGRTVSDLFRAGLDLVVAAGRRVSPWKHENAEPVKVSDDTSPPHSKSDNVPYV